MAGVRRPFQHVFGEFDLLIELPVELRMKPITKEKKHAACVHGEQNGERGGIRQRKASAGNTEWPEDPLSLIALAQDESHAAHGVNQLHARVGVDLLPDTSNVDVDDIIE